MRKDGGGGDDAAKGDQNRQERSERAGAAKSGGSRGYQGKTTAGPKSKSNAPAASTGAFGAALLDAMKKK
jgi:uncharacterized protein